MSPRRFHPIALVALALACTPPKSPTAAPPPSAGIPWNYEVRVTEGLDLDVAASLDGITDRTALAVDEDAQRFVDVIDRGPGRIHYRFRLADAARELDDPTVAYAGGGVIVAPPSTWLLRPSAAGKPTGRFRFHVTTAPGVAFASGVVGEEAGLDALEDSSFVGFGALDLEAIDGGTLRAAIARGTSVPRPSIAKWVGAEAAAVADYFGVPPRGLVFVLPGGDDVIRGVTLGDGGAGVLVRFGAQTRANELGEDWVLAHELVHVSLPSLERKYAWFAEGLATYVEPILRVRAGLLAREKLWSDLVDNLPSGLPRSGEGGLDGSHDNSRVYWGGALYFLTADLMIRERTGGAHTLDDALRAVAATGENVTSHWPLSRFVAIGDHATGTTVLADLYESFGRRAFTTNLDALWARLGVVHKKDTTIFDDGAPLAKIRKEITARR